MNSIGVVEFVVKGLATWRVANLLLEERGPYDLLTTIREVAGGVKHNEDVQPVSAPDNSLFSCIYCMSVWVGLAFAILPKRLALPFALSAAAIFADRGLKWLEPQS